MEGRLEETFDKLMDAYVVKIMESKEDKDDAKKQGWKSALESVIRKADEYQDRYSEIFSDGGIWEYQQVLEKKCNAYRLLRLGETLKDIFDNSFEETVDLVHERVNDNSDDSIKEKYCYTRFLEYLCNNIENSSKRIKVDLIRKKCDL